MGKHLGTNKKYTLYTYSFAVVQTLPNKGLETKVITFRKTSLSQLRDTISFSSHMIFICRNNILFEQNLLLYENSLLNLGFYISLLGKDYNTDY